MKKKILKVFWIFVELVFVVLCFNAIDFYFSDFEILAKQNPENTANVFILGFVYCMLISFFFSKIVDLVLFVWDKIKNHCKFEEIAEDTENEKK